MKCVAESTLLKIDIDSVSSLPLPWEMLKGKSVFVTGASGLIGSFLIDVLMKKSVEDALNIHVFAVSRKVERAKKRFLPYLDSPFFTLIPLDINTPFAESLDFTCDFVLHLASNTHPVAYATHPIETILTNVLGTKNVLDFAIKYSCRSLFASSCEVYGENRGDIDLFDEKYLGYIDCNTLRAGYPESKRCGEALCQAYIKEKDLDIVIPRLTRTYGATMLKDDTKALSQFIGNAVSGKDIVLKSEGKQLFSYTYVTDSVSGILYSLLLGKKGEAYNIADESGSATLKDIAQFLADVSGTKVVFEVPDAIEKSGYSTATKSLLDGTKLHSLGWKPLYDLKEGLERTVKILRSLEKEPRGGGIGLTEFSFRVLPLLERRAA